ncbi:MAG: hypothetical protein U1F21_16960 [Sphaerotilus natans]
MKNLRVSLSTLAAASRLLTLAGGARADAATDACSLAADHAAYRAQQQAIADLNATGRHPLRSHPLGRRGAGSMSASMNTPVTTVRPSRQGGT